MSELVIDYGKIDITDNWEGFFLNYLLPEDHPNHDKPHNPPNDIDWKKDLRKGLYLEASQPKEIGFLWTHKTWYLHLNPESSSLMSLDEPIAIVEGRYHYGNFEELEPKKQDLVLFGYYKETPESEVILKPYRTLRNPLKKQGAREEIIEYRRSAAESYIKQRAKEIDVVTASLFASLGEKKASEKGLQQLNLWTGIETFFEIFSSEMFAYRRAGSKKIIEAISSVMADSDPPINGWLKENILVDIMPGGDFVLVPAGAIISEIFTKATAVVSQREVNTFAVGYPIEK